MPSETATASPKGGTAPAVEGGLEPTQARKLLRKVYWRTVPSA